MALQLFDTAQGKKVHLVRRYGETIRMYACGPTVYDVPHLGNARPAVVADLLYRLLRDQHKHLPVTYARNFTDIDDKIIERANARGVPIETVTAENITAYMKATRALNVLDPDVMPRATESLPAINEMIERLVKLCSAYVAEGHVLFDVSASTEHTRLIADEVEHISGYRIAPASYKDDPRDFVLWKPSKEGEPSYDGPFGLKGRPGWHIECSAMIAQHLGETIDIHLGGGDLIFPHHTCEIMQSEAANGKPLSKVWIHNGMLTVDGRKMAKSAGNFITVDEALARFPGEALRYLLLSGHYRQPLDFTWDKLAEAKTALDRLYRALALVIDLPEPSLEEKVRNWDRYTSTKEYTRNPAGLPVDHSDLSDELNAALLLTPNPVEYALDDDLNTPQALAAMHEMAGRIFTRDIHRDIHRHDFIKGAELLGILQQTPDEWFRSGVDAESVERLIEVREVHRRNRDFQQADAVREQLRQMGVVVEDTAKGPVWQSA